MHWGTFSAKVAGHILIDRLTSEVNRERLGVGLLLLPIKGSGGLGIFFGCPLDASLGRSSSHVPPGGGPGNKQGQDGGIMSLG